MRRLGHTVPANNKPNFYPWAICVELGKSTFVVQSCPRHLLPLTHNISTGTNLELQLEGKGAAGNSSGKRKHSQQKDEEEQGGWGRPFATEAVHDCQKEIVPKFILCFAVWVEPTILWAKPMVISPVVVVDVGNKILLKHSALAVDAKMNKQLT